MTPEMLKQLEQLATLFKARDQAYEDGTEAIFIMLGPTVVECLYDMFNVSYEAVKWMDIQVADNILLMVASVTYDKDNKIPSSIEQLSPEPPPGTELTGRVFRIGIPLDMVFESRETISEFLKSAVKKKIPPSRKVVPVEPPSVEFDSTALTKEQVQQIVIFQEQTKGIKH